jgi:hypothetical protein
MAQPCAVSVGSLRQVIADLDQLNQDTKLDSLRIGGKPAEFMRAVSAISSELTDLADSEQGECAALALTHALDRSTEMRTALGDRDGGLAALRREIGILKRTLTEFEGSVSAFHTLALFDANYEFTRSPYWALQAARSTSSPAQCSNWRQSAEGNLNCATL